MPFWGFFLPKYGARNLLAACCLIWLFATILTPSLSYIPSATCLRVLNGVALAGVVPISQAILADNIVEEKRGRAFGFMAGLHQLAKAVVNYAVISQS